MDYKSLAKNILSDLISFESVNKPGNEKPLAQYINHILSTEGFKTEIQNLGNNRANIIAKFGNSDNIIIFNGHLDVVPQGSAWIYPPFKLTETDTRFYGRGTCDMKGAIASMITAAIKLKADNAIDSSSLMLVFVADEEVDGMGTKYFINNFKNPGKSWVVIGEATENMPNIAHRGVIRFNVTIRGIQCHASNPDLGINALTLASKFLLAIDKLNYSMKMIKHEILPSPTIAATIIECGTKDNVIPGQCKITLDCRTIPTQSVQVLSAEINNVLTNLFDSNNTNISWEIEPFIEVFPSMIDKSKSLVLSAENTYSFVYKKSPILTYFPACCDMSWFNAAGYDSIICGPGNITQAHISNEYIDKQQFYDSIKIYETLFLTCQKKQNYKECT